MIDAEASREQFIMSARIAFRDPYRALKAWERHEWRNANLTFKDRDDVEVVNRAHAAVEKSKGRSGLELRGRRRFGREDGERIAAREALSDMVDARANWLASVKRAQTSGQARDRVGLEQSQLIDRIRKIRSRRSDLMEQLREQARLDGGAREKALDRAESQRRSHARPFIDMSIEMNNAIRRCKRLDRRAARYMTAISDLRRVDGNEKSPRLQSLERRLAAYRIRHSDLNAVIARADNRLEEIEVTEKTRADLTEMHRAYGTFADKSLQHFRPPVLLSVRDRVQFETMERRTARIEKAIVRYRERLAILSDPEFDIPEKGDRDSGYKIRDPDKRRAALSSARSRLSVAELRHRNLHERRVAQTLCLWPRQERDTRSEKDIEADREARAEKERRRLERLYRSERQRDSSWELDR